MPRERAGSSLEAEQILVKLCNNRNPPPTKEHQTVLGSRERKSSKDEQNTKPRPPRGESSSGQPRPKIILAIASTHLMLYETYDAATRATITDTTPTKYNEVYTAAILALPKSSLRRCHLRGRLVTGTVK